MLHCTRNTLNKVFVTRTSLFWIEKSSNVRKKGLWKSKLPISWVLALKLSPIRTIPHIVRYPRNQKFVLMGDLLYCLIPKSSTFINMSLPDLQCDPHLVSILGHFSHDPRVFAEFAGWILTHKNIHSGRGLIIDQKSSIL